MSPQPRILMCPPDYYGIHYEINAWMNTQRQSVHATAVEQWNDLKKLLTATGAKVELLEPVNGLPDLVFTANAALVYQGRAVLSRFRHEQRQGEAREPCLVGRLDADASPLVGFPVRNAGAGREMRWCRSFDGTWHPAVRN